MSINNEYITSYQLRYHPYSFKEHKFKVNNQSDLNVEKTNIKNIFKLKDYERIKSGNSDDFPYKGKVVNKNSNHPYPLKNYEFTDCSINFKQNNIKNKPTEKIYEANDFEKIKLDTIYSENFTYEGEIVNGKPHGIGEIKYLNGAIIETNWENGIKQGKGKIIYPNVMIIEATFINDKLNGEAKIIYSNEDTEHVHYVDDAKHGTAFLRSKNGSVYTENWNYGIRDGQTMLITNEGKIIKKMWKEGIVSFQTEIYYNDDFRSSYIGASLAELPHGYGKMIYSDNSFYEGNWFEELCDGRGKLTFPSGKIVHSIWNKGTIDAHGRIEMPNTDNFIGGIANYEPHGEGILCTHDNCIITGTWNKGLLHGRGTIQNNQNEFTGNWNQGCLDGPSTTTKTNGTIIEETWNLGKRNSTTRISYKNGSIYEGECFYELDTCLYPEGKGVMIYGNGVKREGTWKEGRYVKETNIPLENHSQEQNAIENSDNDFFEILGFFTAPNEESEKALSIRDETSFLNDDNPIEEKNINDEFLEFESYFTNYVPEENK